MIIFWQKNPDYILDTKKSVSEIEKCNDGGMHSSSAFSLINISHISMLYVQLVCLYVSLI